MDRLARRTCGEGRAAVTSRPVAYFCAMTTPTIASLIFLDLVSRNPRFLAPTLYTVASLRLLTTAALCAYAATTMMTSLSGA